MTQMSDRARKLINATNAIAVVVLLILVGCLHYEHIPFQEKRLTARERDVVDKFHKLWHSPNQNTWRDNKWFGVRTLQNPMDIWITQEIIVETKPDFIVETGTFHGGSALVWATILQQVNPNGRVITVDIEDHAQEAKELPLWKEKVDFLLGSSVAPEVIEAVRKKVEGKKVLVIFDSEHHKDHVLKELLAYSPFVQVGGYIIVQDTNLSGHPVHQVTWSGPGPMEAVEEFLAFDKRFEPDQSRERLLLTFCPRGFLKRVN